MQDLLIEDGAEIWKKLSSERALVFVSGNAKIPKAVQNALEQIASDFGNFSYHSKFLSKFSNLNFERIVSVSASSKSIT